MQCLEVFLALYRYSDAHPTTCRLNVLIYFTLFLNLYELLKNLESFHVKWSSGRAGTISDFGMNVVQYDQISHIGVGVRTDSGPI